MSDNRKGGLDLERLHSIRAEDVACVIDLSHPLQNRIDLTCRATLRNPDEYASRSLSSSPPMPISDTDVHFTVRASLSLVLSNPLAEAVLSSMEHTIDLPKLFALKLRASCVKVIQSIPFLPHKEGGIVEDLEWRAVEVVLLVIFEYGLYGRMAEMVVSEEEEGGGDEDDAWRDMMSSDFHYRYERDHADLFSFEKFLKNDLEITDVIEAKRNDTFDGGLKELVSVLLYLFIDDISSCKESICTSLFDTLHLLYEDCKLNTCSNNKSWMISLGKLLMQITFLPGVSMEDYLNHYRRDLSAWCRSPDLNDLFRLRPEPSGTVHRFSSFEEPPCIFSWMDGMMRGYGTDKNDANVYNRPELSLPTKKKCFAWTRKIHRLFSILFDECDEARSCDRIRSIDRRVVLAMVEEGITNPSLLQEELPVGISLPLMEVLYRCRIDPPSSKSDNWPPAAYHLIGRPDLAEMESLKLTHTQPSNLSFRHHPDSRPSSSTSLSDPDQDGGLRRSGLGIGFRGW